MSSKFGKIYNIGNIENNCPQWVPFFKRHISCNKEWKLVPTESRWFFHWALLWICLQASSQCRHHDLIIQGHKNPEALMWSLLEKLCQWMTGCGSAVVTSDDTEWDAGVESCLRKISVVIVNVVYPPPPGSKNYRQRWLWTSRMWSCSGAFSSEGCQLSRMGLNQAFRLFDSCDNCEIW